MTTTASRGAFAVMLLLATLIAAPAQGADVITLTGSLTLTGNGTGTLDVVIPADLDIRSDVEVTITSDADTAGLALVERGARGKSPHGASWTQVDTDEVCARTPDCDDQFIDGVKVIGTPETQGVLPPGGYQLVIFATPEAPVSVTIAMSGSEQVTLTDLTPASNVQAVRIQESDPTGLDETWWAGAERDIDDGALLFLIAAVAGDFSGPHEFNACVYIAGTISDTLGEAGLNFAPPCAHGTSAGARVVAVKTDYSATLTASVYTAAGGTIGLGAYVNGPQSVTGSVVSGLWIDPKN